MSILDATKMGEIERTRWLYVRGVTQLTNRQGDDTAPTPAHTTRHPSREGIFRRDCLSVQERSKRTECERVRDRDVPDQLLRVICMAHRTVTSKARVSWGSSTVLSGGK